MKTRLEEIEARFVVTSNAMTSPEVASDPDRLRILGKSFAELEEIVVPYRAWKQANGQAEEARELAKSESDPDMATYFREEAEQAQARAEALSARLESLLVAKDPNDGRDVILEVRAGAGGQEAALFAGQLVDMYRRFAEHHRWKIDVLSTQTAELGGLKEAALEIRGRDAFSKLKHESGVHRVQRVPVTESQGRIHTSTATVAVMPVAEEIEIEIRPEDIDLQVFRSQGPGGQSVNTTDSAVRITHRPSGIVVTCQEERSQLQNREKAMRYLRARLLRRAQEDAAAKEASSRRSQVGTGDRSEKIRTYNFPESRVTDHRIKLTLHRLQDVLAGNLDGFVEALQNAERVQQLAAQDE